MELRKIKPENICGLISGLDSYPALDSRFDHELGAKRIEWSFDDTKDTMWAAITDVNDPGLACKVDPNAFEIKSSPALQVASTPDHRHCVPRQELGPMLQYSGLESFVYIKD